MCNGLEARPIPYFFYSPINREAMDLVPPSLATPVRPDSLAPAMHENIYLLTTENRV